MNFVERHQDYVLDIGTLIGVLQSGQIRLTLSLTLDTDAPFICRSLAFWCQGGLATGQADMTGLLYRIQREGGAYTSDDYIPLIQQSPTFGQLGNPIPLQREMTCPAASSIAVDVSNTGVGSANITGLQIIFRGVKLYKQGVLPYSSTYPKTCRILPFIYRVPQRNVVNPGIPYPQPANILIPVNGSVTNVPFRVDSDADFVFRGMQAQCGGFDETFPSAFIPRNVWATLKDRDYKPYSNAPVPLSVLAGQGSAGIINAALGIPAYYNCGNFHPGMMFPEIYLQANDFMFLDFTRNDSAFRAAVPSNMEFDVIGSKVFPA